MSNSVNKTLSLAIGAAFLGSMTLSPIADAANPFQMNDLDRGYMVIGEDEKEEEGKCGEGKCGEGQCGEGSCGEDHGEDSEEGEEGEEDEEDKGEEGKCGEGSCGAA